MAAEVYTVERYGSLAEQAQERLARLGFTNVHVLHADGSGGWPEHAPYQGILVSAGAPEIPPALREQLAVGGRMVIPVGAFPSYQTLTRVTRVSADDFREEPFEFVVFVPLIPSVA